MLTTTKSSVNISSLWMTKSHIFLDCRYKMPKAGVLSLFCRQDEQQFK